MFNTLWAFSAIIVNGSAGNILSCQFWCANPSQWTIQKHFGHCKEHLWLSFWKIPFCDNMRLQQKNVWNCDYQPQVCTIWKIKHLDSLPHHKPPKFSNFYVYTSPLTKLEVFFLKHHFMRKREMSFSFDWDLWRKDFFIYNIDFVSLLIVLSEWSCSQQNNCDSLFFKTLAQLKAATALFFL